MKNKKINKILLALFLVFSVMIPQTVLADSSQQKVQNQNLTIFKEKNTPEVQVRVLKEEEVVIEDTMTQDFLELSFSNKEDGIYSINFNTNDSNYLIKNDEEQIELRDGFLSKETLSIGFNRLNLSHDIQNEMVDADNYEDLEQSDNKHDVVANIEGNLKLSEESEVKANLDQSVLIKEFKENNNMEKARSKKAKSERAPFIVEAVSRPSDKRISAEFSLLGLEGSDKGRRLSVNSGETLNLEINRAYLIDIINYDSDSYQLKRDSAIIGIGSDKAPVIQYVDHKGDGKYTLFENEAKRDNAFDVYELKEVRFELKEYEEIVHKGVAAKDLPMIEAGSSRVRTYSEVTLKGSQFKIKNGFAIHKVPVLGPLQVVQDDVIPGYEKRAGFRIYPTSVNNSDIPVPLINDAFKYAANVGFMVEFSGYNYRNGEEIKRNLWNLPVEVGFSKDGVEAVEHRLHSIDVNSDIPVFYPTAKTGIYIDNSGLYFHSLLPGEYGLHLRNLNPLFVIPGGMDYRAVVGQREDANNPKNSEDFFIPARLGVANYTLIFIDENGIEIPRTGNENARFKSTGLFTNKVGFQDRALGGELTVGDYQLEILSAPEGYELLEGEAIQNFEIKEDGDNKEVVVNVKKKEPFGVLELYIKNRNDMPLDGVIELEEKSTGEIIRVNVVDGIAVETEFPIGVYAISVAKVTFGYTPEEVVISRNLAEGSHHKLEFLADYADYYSLVRKIDQNGNPLEGAKFELYKNGIVVEEIESDSEGIAYLDTKVNIIDQFYLKEIDAPEGYELLEDKIAIEVTEENYIDTKGNGDPDEFYVVTEVTNIKSSEERADIVGKNIDEDGNPMKDGKFIVINKESGEELEVVVENGSIETKLPKGDYTMKQSEAPKGYELSLEKKDFTVSDDGKVTGDDLVFTSNYKRYKIKVNKTNEISMPLAGVEFTIYNAKKEASESLETNAQGVVEFEVTIKDSFVKETKGDKLHKMSQEEYSIKHLENETQEIHVENVRKFIEVEIERQDNEGEYVEGPSKVIVVDKNTGEKYEVNLINGKGKVELPGGDFEVKETEKPKEYLPAEDVDISINDDMEIVGNPVLTSEQKKYQVEISHQDERGDKIAGGVFEVTNKDTGKKEIITLEEGETNINLPAGNYEVQQTDGPEGYEQSVGPQEITLGEDTETDANLKFISDFTEYVVVVNKTNEIGNVLEGVVFELENRTTKKKELGTTRSSGNTRFLVNLFDDYVVVEKEGHKAHLSTDEVFEVDVRTDKETLVNVINNRKFTEVEIERQDQEGSLVEGDSKVIIVDKGTGEEYEVELVDGKGKVELPAGDFEIKETEIPEGYKPAPGIDLSINDDMELENKPILSSDLKSYEVVITYIDERGNQVNSGTFEVVNKKTGEKEVISFEEGEEIINLVPGDYTITQVDVPEGYKTAINKVFNISKDGAIFEDLTLVSEYETYDLKILKTNERDDPLAGVEFSLTNKTLDADLSLLTNEEGLVVFEFNIFDEYELKETKGHKAHESSEEVIEFNVTAKDSFLKVINNRKFIEVEIERQDLDGNYVKGSSKVTILDKKTGEEYQVELIDGKGKVNLPAGEFEVKEKSIPKGYKPASDIELKVSEDMEIDDKPILSSDVKKYPVKITHKDEDGDKVSGGRFEVINKKTGTTENLELPEGESIIYLPEGDFIVSELERPLGYEQKEDLEFSVTNNEDNAFEIISDLTRYDLLIIKENEIKQPLENVEFEISRPDGSKKQGAVTDKYGQLSFKITFKDYVLKEIKGAVGHIQNDEELGVKVDPHMDQTVIIVENKRKFVEVEIDRIDNDGNPILEESKVIVIDKNTGEEYEVTIIDGQGVVNLPTGDFLLKELDTPLGYNPASDLVFSVNIELKVDKDVVLVNEKIKDDGEEEQDDQASTDDESIINDENNENAVDKDDSSTINDNKEESEDLNGSGKDDGVVLDNSQSGENANDNHGIESNQNFETVDTGVRVSYLGYLTTILISVLALMIRRKEKESCSR